MARILTNEEMPSRVREASVPPVTTKSASPRRRYSKASIMACPEEEQALLVV
ncbi:MAG: hypothetical protein RL215_1379 [Planctomycetota bacterium]